MNDPDITKPPGRTEVIDGLGDAAQIVPTLVTGAAIATCCAFFALLTGMDTVFKVAGLIAVFCVVVSAAILERAERRRLAEDGVA